MATMRRSSGLLHYLYHLVSYQGVVLTLSMYTAVWAKWDFEIGTHLPLPEPIHGLQLP